MPQVDLPVRTRRFTVSPLINILPIVLIWVALAHAQTESEIYNFNANNGDGSQPFTSLVSDAAGNLYGTTSVGGAFQAGTVFKLTHGTSGWTETLLYSFSGGKDGHQPGGHRGPHFPQDGLVQDFRHPARVSFPVVHLAEH